MARLLVSRPPLDAAGTQLTAFIRFCEGQTGHSFSDYAAFEFYCANCYADFWALFLEWSRVLCEGSAAPVVTDERCEFATFFPGLRLNYAENLLRVDGDGFEPTRPALTALHRDRPAERWSRGELRARVSALAAGLVELGLEPGQRVALAANNTASAVLGCLGASAIGCSVSSGALDVGAFALISRFAQVEPVLLLADLPDPGTATGRQQRERFVEVARALPSLRGVLLLDDGEEPAGLGIPVHRASALLQRHAGAPAKWPRLPFDHPLFILFTSGTTGPPKCLVHGAGGTLLEHVKEHRLHGDLRPSDKLFFHTSTGWMMWNWQLSALAVGTEIVLNDSPVTGADSLWHIAAQERVTAFGTSPPYLRLCEQSAWAPPPDADFSALRAIYSTGSILHPRQQEWVWRRVKHLPIQSISGGTDIVGCFVLGNPNLPVFSAECQSRSLGLDVRALNADAQGIGELVCANPFPSRPVGLLNDADGSRFHAAYFAQNSGMWTHGDLVEFTAQGSARMHGRCDGVLNIRGIRIGPAEIYGVLDDVPQIADAMAVEQRTDDEGDGRLVLLLVLKAGCRLDRELDAHIKRELGRRGSPAHVPAVILAVDQLPTTYSGKHSERSARDALSGHAVANTGALRNPESLEPLRAYAAQEPRAAPPPAASADLQQLVTGVWESVLGLAPIRPADNYFDLGGDSLRALRIMAEIKRLTGRNASMKLLWDAPTVAGLSAALSREAPAPYQPLVLLESGAETTPLFIVHGVGGSAMELLPLARQLRADRPVYALQGRGFDVGDAPHAHVDDMVREYLAAVRSIQPRGPYLLAGYSFGGLVAYEMGRRLAATGEQIALLALLDTSVPERHWSRAAWAEYFFRRLRCGLRELRNRGLRDWAPLCLGLASALIERLRHRRFSAERLADRPDAAGALPEQALRVRRAGFAAALAQPPQPSALSLTLFRSDLDASHACDPALVWRALVPTLDIYDVPGTHSNMIRSPQVELLAGCLGQRLRAASLALAVAVAGCGGGGGGGDTPDVVPPAETLLGMPDPIPAGAASAGAWSALQDWPIIPIHVVLLPDGRVVNFGTDANTYPYVNTTTSFNYDIWSPSMGFGDSSHLTLENTTGTPGQTSIDFFCAAQILLPEPMTSGSLPSVLVVGGDTYPRPDPYSIYAGGNPNSALIGNDNLVTKAADMSRGRWYASVTTLLNGDIYVQGGTSSSYPSGVDHPELRSQGAFHLLTGITTGVDPVNDPEGNGDGSYRFYYPRNFVAPDGRVFGYDTWGRMYYVDPYANGGAGSLTPLIPSASGTTFEGDYQGDTSTPAMFSPGRILQVGGYANRALVIDIRGGGAPLLTPTGSFSRLRKLATATLLPTGEVAITGGSEVWNELVNASKAAETWSPVTGTWHLGSEAVVERLYHSSALLLLNGSVLVGGGGGPGPRMDPNDPDSPTISNFSAEVFFPRYLFKTAAAGSELASRPTIGPVSEDPRVRRRFTLNYSAAPDGIARVTLVKTGATTHGLNMDQRFVELSFRTVSPGQLDVRMPSNPADAPPGYYLLSVIDPAGHPSISKAVFVNTAPAREPAADPSVTNPGDRVSAVGVAIAAFNVGGSDPNGPVTFAAGKLPPGISIDASGRVSGTPSAAGSYDSVASVSDGERTATANFVWTVN